MIEIDTLVDLIHNQQPLTAMLAPSFPIVFEYPQIVGKLKRIGFQYVVEVAAGAVKTNEAVLSALKSDPTSRFIASPCASFSRFVKTQYPALVKYLAEQVDSPMTATAKIVKEKYPGSRPVFIGPCVVKKLEASQDHPELNILVLTYSELNQVFEKLGVLDSPLDSNATFDISERSTRLYPISGGLSQSSGLKDILSESQYEVVSGWQNCKKALDAFEKNKDLRFLDILYCDGGCISGPGIVSTLDLPARRQKVIDFWQSGA